MDPERKNPIVEQEESPLPITTGKGNADIEAAILITKRFIESYEGEEQGPARAEKILALVSAEIDQLCQERTQQALQEKERLLMFLIKGGRSALDAQMLDLERSQLSINEKSRRKIRLFDDYIDARLLERMTAVEIKEQLIARLLNPFNTAAYLARFTDSQQDEKGNWISEFQPNSRLAGFVSRQTIEEIRFGIQSALQIKQRISDLCTKYRRYDGKIDGQAMIKDLFEKEIKGGVEVIEGPISLTVVLYDENEYSKIHGETPATQSGGRHHRYFPHVTQRKYGDQYTDFEYYQKTGLINIIKFSSYDSETISHENEHGLYEILLATRGKKAPALETSCKKLLSTSAPSRQRLLYEAVNEALFEADDRFIAGFANEAMAYVLNNEEDYRKVDDIIESNFRRLTTSKLYEHLHLTPEKLTALQQSLLNEEGIVRKNIDDLTHDEGQRKQIEDFLTAYEKKAIDDTSKDSIEKILRNIIRAVAELKKAMPHNPNRIRAILAGQNPVRWPDITYSYRQYKEGDAGYQRKVRNESTDIARSQTATARALLFELFREDVDITGQGEKMPEVGDQERVKMILDASEVKEAELTEGTINITTKARDRYYLDLNGKRINTDKRIVVVSRTGGRLVLYAQVRGEKYKVCLLDHEGKTIIGDYDNIKRDSIIVNEKGKIAALVTKDDKTYIATEDGKRIGMEYLSVADPEYDHGKIYFRAMVERNKWIVADEENNQISAESYQTVDYLVKIGNRLVMKVEEKGKQYYKDLSNKTIGPKEGFDVRHDGTIIEQDGYMIIHCVDNTSNEGMSWYYLEDGQEVFPAPTGYNLFADVNGELVTRVAANGNESWQTKDKRIVGGEHREVGHITKFSDNTYAIRVVDNEDGQPSYVDLDSNIIRFPLDIKVKQLDLLKNRDGQYIWIYTIEEDDNDHIIDNKGTIIESGKQIYPVPIEGTENFVLFVHSENIVHVLNDRGEKISEDYEEIKTGNEIVKDASGHYFILGRRGKQYFKERLEL